MSCYSPNVVRWSADPFTGEASAQFLGQLRDQYTYDHLEEQAMQLVPCGQCIGCRLDYSRHWADRLVLELSKYNGSALFITLTYNDDHLPLSDDFSVPTLLVRDTQLYHKRLRKAFPDRVLRFFMCGEYGSITHRPHYHEVLFGLSMCDFSDLRPCQRNELGQLSFTSPTLEKIWSNGFILFSEISYASMCYVSRYSLKKAFGYSNDPRQHPEFLLMSRRPGIGLDYFESHDPTDVVFFSGKKISIPRSVLDRCGDSAFVSKVLEQRQRLAHDTLLTELSLTDLPYLDYIKVKERSKAEKIAKLKKRSDL
ncbi:replication initiator protein [Capybara microvirus Cap3_SP_541]|nr:replication initiator protein [Capybara microvirus Cap3_SP_541]